MKTPMYACLVCLSLIVCGPAAAAETPLEELIAVVASKTGKKFVVDPRARAQVILIGQEPSKVTFADLGTILQLHGFVLFEGGGYVRVLPDAMARTLPVPIAAGNERHGDAEIVSRVIKVKSMPAASLVPLLRPLVPQYGHLVAVPCTNTLMLVDTYANVKRLESVVQSLDTSEPYQPEKCGAPPAAASARD